MGMASGLPRISQASTWLQNTGMSSGLPWPVRRGRKIGRSGGTSFGVSQGWSRSSRNVRVVSAPKRAPPGTLLEVHQAALRNAGFREVDVIWQHLDNRVVMAVR